MGTGIGKINTLVLGVSTASAPPRAKTAPEAPMATEAKLGFKRDSNPRKNKLPSKPPPIYITQNHFSFISLNKIVPKNYRVNMLANRWNNSRWTNIEVNTPQGYWMKTSTGEYIASL